MPHAAERDESATSLQVAPSLAPALAAADIAPQRVLVDGRVVAISGLAVAVAIAAGFVAQLLTALIGIFTNLAFYGRLSTAFVSPAANRLGPFVIAVPVVGGFIVGLMARYGSQAIRGHGIPEAMEQVLDQQEPHPRAHDVPQAAVGGDRDRHGRSVRRRGADHRDRRRARFARRPARADERQRAEDPARGRRRSRHGGDLRQSGLGGAARDRAAALRVPAAIADPGRARGGCGHGGAHRVRWARRRCSRCRTWRSRAGAALACYALIGALLGVASVGVTRAVYAIEDGFEHLPIHWMWWPALGAVAVGAIGYFAPADARRRLRQHRADPLGRPARWRVVVVLCVLKFLSWSISLGSGTSGGTLAPLFTIGGGLGALLGTLRARARARARRRRADRRARRHGRDLRGRLARAAGVGRVRVRDHAPADRTLAAARRAAPRRTSCRAC